MYQTFLTQSGSELEKVLEEAAQLADKPWYDRFFRSKKNMDTIDSLKEKIVQACQAFQVSGNATRLSPCDLTIDASTCSFRET